MSCIPAVWRDLGCRIRGRVIPSVVDLQTPKRLLMQCNCHGHITSFISTMSTKKAQKRQASDNESDFEASDNSPKRDVKSSKSKPRVGSLLWAFSYWFDWRASKVSQARLRWCRPWFYSNRKKTEIRRESLHPFDLSTQFTAEKGTTSHATPTSSGESHVEIGKKRRVTVSVFKGKPLVDIREYYGSDGDEKPGKKGISLTVEQVRSHVSMHV